MTRTIFGTDGVRGRTNCHPMTADVALRLAVATARWFRRGAHRHRVVIGKDTRLSGYMLEGALQAGFTAAGMDVFLLGPAPTPAVGMLTRALRADIGVMISASHNAFEDNGLKLFGPDGFKLSDSAEAEIEALMDEEPALATSEAIGRVRRLSGGLERYLETAKSSFPRSLRLDRLKVLVDCANGAAYRAAPAALWELGAEVSSIGVTPDGLNINAGVGSTNPQACREAVLAQGADVGLAFDGDADRVMIIDERGQVVDGDQIMALIATRWAREGRLTGGALVATVMSNMGLERRLAQDGLTLLRTRVGDRYVAERMRETGCNLGGEQSGHVIMSDFATTCDGLIAALQVLAAIVETGEPASKALAMFEPMPQRLSSVRHPPGAQPLERAAVRACVNAVTARLAGRGRLLVRASGTEPVVRVMAEAEDAAAVDAAVDEVVAALGAAN